MDRFAEVLILSNVFLAMLAGHKAEWPLVESIVDARGYLHRPLAYAYGCGFIFLGMAAWAVVSGPSVPV